MDGQLANRVNTPFKVFAWDQEGNSFSGETKSMELVKV